MRFLFFFFKQKTAYEMRISDWSSDVCSSDLLVTSLLTEALVARGLDVTLFATADSITSGKLQAVVPRGYSEEPGADATVLEIQHIAHFFEHAGAFDILHNQADFVPLAFSRLVSTPKIGRAHV